MNILNKTNLESKMQVEEVGGVGTCLAICGFFCGLSIFTTIAGAAVTGAGGAVAPTPV